MVQRGLSYSETLPGHCWGYIWYGKTHTCTENLLRNGTNWLLVRYHYSIWMEKISKKKKRKGLICCGSLKLKIKRSIFLSHFSLFLHALSQIHKPCPKQWSVNSPDWNMSGFCQHFASFLLFFSSFFFSFSSSFPPISLSHTIFVPLWLAVIVGPLF